MKKKLKSITLKNLELKTALKCVNEMSAQRRVLFYFTKNQIRKSNKILSRFIGKIHLNELVRHNETKIAILLRINI